MGMKPTQQLLQLEIGELVLHGFPSADRFEIANAVEQELMRLVANHGIHGLSPGSATIDRVGAGACRVEAGAQPRSVGTHIGQAVFEGLMRR